MNRSAYTLILASLTVGTVLGSADPVDPIFSTGDPSVGTPIYSNSFSFSSDPLGGGVLAFVNDSRYLWTTMDVFVNEAAGTPITCLPELFFNACTVSQTPVAGGMTQFDIKVSDTSGTAGILPGVFFIFNLNGVDTATPQSTDPLGAGGWGADAKFSVVADASVAGNPGVTADPTSVPEPASLLLMATGLGLVCYGRRRSHPRFRLTAARS